MWGVLGLEAGCDPGLAALSSRLVFEKKQQPSHEMLSNG